MSAAHREHLRRRLLDAIAAFDPRQIAGLTVDVLHELVGDMSRVGEPYVVTGNRWRTACRTVSWARATHAEAQGRSRAWMRGYIVTSDGSLAATNGTELVAVPIMPMLTPIPREWHLSPAESARLRGQIRIALDADETLRLGPLACEPALAGLVTRTLTGVRLESEVLNLTYRRQTLARLVHEWSLQATDRFAVQVEIASSGTLTLRCQQRRCRVRPVSTLLAPSVRPSALVSRWVSSAVLMGIAASLASPLVQVIWRGEDEPMEWREPGLDGVRILSAPCRPPATRRR